MNCQDIHNGLPNQLTRDYLGKNIRESYDGEVERLEAEIKRLQAKLDIAKREAALRGLMAAHGWNEYDVSSDVADFHPDRYMPFIGTKAEYHEFMEAI